jgi:hypothetical protein
MAGWAPKEGSDAEPGFWAHPLTGIGVIIWREDDDEDDKEKKHREGERKKRTDMGEFLQGFWASRSGIF